MYWETNYFGVRIDKLEQPVLYTGTATAGPWIEPLQTFPEPCSISPVILFEELLFHKTTWQRAAAAGGKWFDVVGPSELERTTDGEFEESSVFFPRHARDFIPCPNYIYQKTLCMQLKPKPHYYIQKS
jgi:hypothetical protein